MEQYEIRIFPTAKQDLLDVIDYLNTLSRDSALKCYDRLVSEIAPCRSVALVRGTWRWQQRGIGIWLWGIIWFSMLLPEILCRFAEFCMLDEIIRSSCRASIQPSASLRAYCFIPPDPLQAAAGFDPYSGKAYK